MNENQISKLNLQKKNQQTKILFIIEEIKKKIFYFFAIYFQSQNIKFL